MPKPIRVRVDMRQLSKAFAGFDRRLQSADPEGIIADTIVASIDDLIASEGNGSWPPFSPVTLKVHPKRRGGKLLQDTGQLAQMQPESAPGLATVTSPAPYAFYHQEETNVRGLVNSSRKKPIRDPMGIDLMETLEEACVLIVQEIVR